MKEAYARLAFELQGKGFSVAPDVTADLPSDAGALAIVKDALAKAEASVHLVGEKPGFAPEGLDPIVKLQLVLAREKAMQNADQSQRVFRRIIRFPKILDAGEPSAGAPLRDAIRFKPSSAATSRSGPTRSTATS